MITTADQSKQMSIERQEEPKNSFMGVSMEPSVNKKKFHSHVYVCRSDSLNLAGTWVTHPVLVTWLFGWKYVLSPVANVPAFSRSTRFSLQGSFEEGDCLGIDILSFELPSANGGGGGAWLSCRWLCVHLWYCALKPLHLRVESNRWMGECFHSSLLVSDVP